MQKSNNENNLNMKISELNLSSRTLEVLESAGIKFLKDLISVGKRGLFRIKNLGIRSYEETVSKVESLGYKFSDELLVENKLDESIENKLTNEEKKVDTSMKIKKLKLSTRSFNALDSFGIKTVEDLLAYTSGEIKNIKRLGNKSFNEVVNKINEMGLKFSEEKPVELSEEKRKLLNKKINKLKISNRAINVLNSNGIKTVNDLISLTTVELQKTKKLGNVCYKEILDCIHSLDLRFVNEKQLKLKEKTNILDKPINTLNISNGLYYVLSSKLHIKTVRDLIKTPTSRIKNTRGIGPGTYEILLNIVHDLGLEFDDEKAKAKREKIFKENNNKNEEIVIEEKKKEESMKSSENDKKIKKIENSIIDNIDFWLMEEVNRSNEKFRDNIYKSIREISYELSDLSKKTVKPLDANETSILRYRLGIITGKEESFEAIGKAINVQTPKIIHSEINLYRKLIAEFNIKANREVYTKNELLNLTIHKQSILPYPIISVLSRNSIVKVKDLTSLSTTYIEDFLDLNKKQCKEVFDFVHNLGLGFSDEIAINNFAQKIVKESAKYYEKDYEKECKDFEENIKNKEEKVEEPKEVIIEEPVKEKEEIIIEEPVEENEEIIIEEEKEEPEEIVIEEEKEETITEPKTITSIESEIEELCSEFDNTIERLTNEKNQLVSKYKSLLKEKQELEMKSKELDTKIESVIDRLKDMGKRYLYGKN